MQKSKSKIGRKAPFTPDQVKTIRSALARRCSDRDTALLEVAFSTALRASDLVTLRIRDVVDDQGRIKVEGALSQKKTGETVEFTLTDTARVAFSPLVAGKAFDAFVFEGDDEGHVHTRTLRRLVKWAASDVLGLDASQYSAHSTRRTLASAVYAETKDIGQTAHVLGHTNVANTLRYLGVDTKRALATVRALAL